MPELPEVESVRRSLLRAEMPGRTITAARVGWEKTVKSPSHEEFSASLAGRKVGDVRRRAKYLVFSLSGTPKANLIVHLGMTGWLWLDPATKEPRPLVRHSFPLDDGRELCFEDGRKFGKMWLVEDPAAMLPRLGPEPLGDECTTETLAASMANRAAPVKALLLEQAVAAGLGNIYADESLFLAGIHPEQEASGLDGEGVARLRLGIIEALTAGCAVYDRARDALWPNFPEPMTAWTHPRTPGAACPACGSPFAVTRIRGRTTYYCPECQK